MHTENNQRLAVPPPFVGSLRYFLLFLLYFFFCCCGASAAVEWLCFFRTCADIRDEGIERKCLLKDFRKFLKGHETRHPLKNDKPPTFLFWKKFEFSTGQIGQVELNFSSETEGHLVFPFIDISVISCPFTFFQSLSSESDNFRFPRQFATMMRIFTKNSHFG